MEQAWEQIETTVGELHDLNTKVLELNALLRITALDFRDAHSRLGKLCEGLDEKGQTPDQAYVRSYIDQYLKAGERLIREFELAGMYDAVPLQITADQGAARERT